MNDSSTGGPLVPAASPAPLEDAALDNLLQGLVVGITGLPGNLVRPRWQPTVPKQPEVLTNWCAIGVLSSTALGMGPSFTQNGSDLGGLGDSTLSRHEDLEILVSMYGPNSGQFARMLRDGLTVPQNIEPLWAVGMAYVESGAMRQVPELINEQWLRRTDFTVRLRRNVTRLYPIDNLVVSTIDVEDDSGHIDDVITVPSSDPLLTESASGITTEGGSPVVTE